jgi:GDP-L-fucose synthase
MGLKILVLGGSGFVGKNVLSHLATTPEHTVISASRKESVDISNYEVFKEFLQKTRPDVIINCAAHVGSLHYVTTYAADVISDNIQMSLNIYKAVAAVCPQTKIINPLSNCSYPGTSDIQLEAEWWNGEVHDSVFSYGNSKRFLYVISKCYEKQYGIKTANFLIPNTFGPGDATDPNKTHALNGMIIRMLEAQKRQDSTFEIWGTGNPVREWAYIDDVVQILIAGITTPENLVYPINLAQNKGYTIKQSAEFIAEAVGFKGSLLFNTKYADGAPVKILDDQKFRKIFPDFSFFDHKQGIKNTVEYYRSQLP